MMEKALSGFLLESEKWEVERIDHMPQIKTMDERLDGKSAEIKALHKLLENLIPGEIQLSA